MYFGKVIGRVVSTVKDPGLASERLLIVQPLTPSLQPTGKQILCTDAMGVGAGELVYWTRGKESSFPFLPTEVPTDTTIVGVIDRLRVC
jgi:ethanolamine utilization protein EutN